MNTNDLDNLKDRYAQWVAVDMDLDDLVETMTDSIRRRLDDLPDSDAINEMDDHGFNLDQE